MRQGRTPKKQPLKESVLRVVTGSTLEPTVEPEAAGITGADPTRVKPLLAAAAAENVEQLKASLLSRPREPTRQQRSCRIARACARDNPGLAPFSACTHGRLRPRSDRVGPVTPRLRRCRSAPVPPSLP
jgi:hypothetical protein